MSKLEVSLSDIGWGSSKGPRTASVCFEGYRLDADSCVKKAIRQVEAQVGGGKIESCDVSVKTVNSGTDGDVLSDEALELVNDLGLEFSQSVGGYELDKLAYNHSNFPIEGLANRESIEEFYPALWDAILIIGSPRTSVRFYIYPEGLNNADVRKQLIKLYGVLDNSPYVDDYRYYAVLSDAVEEAWYDYGYEEFMSNVRQLFSDGDGDDLEELLYVKVDDQKSALFDALMDSVGDPYEVRGYSENVVFYEPKKSDKSWIFRALGISEDVSARAVNSAGNTRNADIEKIVEKFELTEKPGEDGVYTLPFLEYGEDYYPILGRANRETLEVDFPTLYKALTIRKVGDVFTFEISLADLMDEDVRKDLWEIYDRTEFGSEIDRERYVDAIRKAQEVEWENWGFKWYVEACAEELGWSDSLVRSILRDGRAKRDLLTAYQDNRLNFPTDKKQKIVFTDPDTQLNKEWIYKALGLKEGADGKAVKVTGTKKKSAAVEFLDEVDFGTDKKGVSWVFELAKSRDESRRVPGFHGYYAILVPDDDKTPLAGYLAWFNGQLIDVTNTISIDPSVHLSWIPSAYRKRYVDELKRLTRHYVGNEVDEVKPIEFNGQLWLNGKVISRGTEKESSVSARDKSLVASVIRGKVAAVDAAMLDWRDTRRQRIALGSEVLISVPTSQKGVVVSMTEQEIMVEFENGKSLSFTPREASMTLALYPYNEEHIPQFKHISIS